jgi:hypothetical protein
MFNSLDLKSGVGGGGRNIAVNFCVNKILAGSGTAIGPHPHKILIWLLKVFRLTVIWNDNSVHKGEPGVLV